MSEETGEEKKSSPVRKIQMNFKNAVQGIRLFVTDVSPAAREHDQRAQETTERVRAGIRSIMISGSGKRKLLPEEEEKAGPAITRIMGLVKDYDVAWTNLVWDDELHERLLLKSSFMMVIASFDYLLSDLLHCFYEKYPKSLNDEMLLSLGELRKCADVNEAIHALMEKKIEAVLFNPFIKQKTFFQKDLKINTAERIVDWDLVNEACQRRNLLVHNDGIVNRRYLNNIVASRGAKKVKEGDHLSVNKEYFDKVYYEILTGGIVLAQNCWRKWFKNDLLHADSTLVELLDKEVVQREYAVAEKLCLFCREVKTGTEESRHDMDILFCETLKRLGRESEFEKEIRELEKKALSDRQLAALAAVKGDRKAFYENVKKAADRGELHRSDFVHAAVYEGMEMDGNFSRKLDEIFKQQGVKKKSHQQFTNF